MAIRTDAGSDYLSRSSGLPSITAFTVAMWVMFVVDKNDYTALLTLGNSDHSQIGTEADGTSLCITSDNVASSTVATSLNTWYHLVWVHRSNSDNELWVDGTLRVDGFSMTVGAISDIKLGTYDGGGSYFFNGRIAGLKWWEAALSPSEIPQERFTFRPVRRDNLYCFVPILSGSGQRGQDFSGLGHSFTEVGALTDEDGPPIGWGGWVNAYTTIVSASSGVSGSGTASAQLNASGNAQVDKKASGSATAQLNASGNAQVAKQAVGSASAQLNASGNAAATQSASGSATVQANSSGNAAATQSASGSAGAQLNSSGSAQVTQSASGSATAQLNTSGSAQIDDKATGTASGQLNASGNAQVDQKASGSASAQLNASGFAQVGGAVTGIGSASAQLNASGNAQVDQKASGSASGQLNSSGSAAATQSASGSATAQLNTNGNAQVDKKASGSASAQLNASGFAQVGGAVTGSGSASAQLNASGNAQAAQKASGSASAQLNASGFAQIGISQHPLHMVLELEAVWKLNLTVEPVWHIDLTLEDF